MTCQRFLYKLLWRRLGIPIILGCTLVTMFATFYHHSKFKLIDEPENKHLGKYFQDESVDEQIKKYKIRSSLESEQRKDVIIKRRSNNENTLIFRGANMKEKANSNTDNNMKYHSDKKYLQPEAQRYIYMNHSSLLQNLARKPANSSKTFAKSKHKHSFDVIKNSKVFNNKGFNPLDKSSKDKPTYHINNTENAAKNSEVITKNKGNKHNANHRGNKVKHSNDVKAANDNFQVNIAKDKNVKSSNINYKDSYKNDTYRNSKARGLSPIMQNQSIAMHNNEAEMRQGNKGMAFTNESIDLVKETGGEIGGINSKPLLVSSNRVKTSGESHTTNISDSKGLEHQQISSTLKSKASNEGPFQKTFNSQQQGSSLQQQQEERLPVFQDWDNSKQSFCDKRFTGYYNEFARLKDVIVDRTHFEGRTGGEEVKEVLNQREEDEFYKFELGCFQLPCDVRPDYYFNGGFHLNDYLFNMQTKELDYQVDATREEFFIVVTRYEYANIYHTMSDWYNTYLMMKYFNKTASDTNVLIIDSHPKGNIDAVWGTIFNSAQRLSRLKTRTLFSDMVWGMIGYNSPILNHYLDSIPLINQFHQHFLSSYNIKAKEKLNCKKLQIMFIWRHDYVAHPRNPTGKISRKIKNEKELLHTLKKRLKNFIIKGVQIDLFNMKQQLSIIANTDILVGMHGAGLTHAMFLPRHAGIVELVPSYWSSAMDHFMAIAQWRSLLYERWVNADSANELSDDYTNVPVEVISALIRSTLLKMNCMKQADAL